MTLILCSRASKSPASWFRRAEVSRSVRPATSEAGIYRNKASRRAREKGQESWKSEHGFERRHCIYAIVNRPVLSTSHERLDEGEAGTWKYRYARVTSGGTLARCHLLTLPCGAATRPLFLAAATGHKAQSGVRVQSWNWGRLVKHEQRQGHRTSLISGLTTPIGGTGNHRSPLGKHDGTGWQRRPNLATEETEWEPRVLRGRSPGVTLRGSDNNGV